MSGVDPRSRCDAELVRKSERFLRHKSEIIEMVKILVSEDCSLREAVEKASEEFGVTVDYVKEIMWEE